MSNGRLDIPLARFGQYTIQIQMSVETQGTIEDLSPRQREIVELLMCDSRIQAMAKYLGVSQSTVQSHLSQIRKKFEVDTNWGIVSKILS